VKRIAAKNPAMVGAATLVPPITIYCLFTIKRTPVFGSESDAISGVIRIVPDNED
jgi:hypothetical protein